jgi:hypothetical protein
MVLRVAALVALAAFASIGTAAKAQSASTPADLINACSTAIRIDTSDVRQNTALDYALFTIANSSSASQKAQQWAASYVGYGYFKGSYDSNSSESKSFYDSSDEKIQYQMASSVVTRYADERSLSSFDSCVGQALGAGQIYATLKDASDSDFTINLKFLPAPTLRNPQIHLVSNATYLGIPSGILPAGGLGPAGRDMTFTRDNPAMPSTIVIDLYEGNTVLQTVSIRVPALTTVSTRTSSYELDTDISQALCGGYKDSSTHLGPPIDLSVSGSDHIVSHTEMHDDEQIPGDRRLPYTDAGWLVIDKDTSTEVTAHATCAPQYSDKFYFSAAHLRVRVERPLVTIVSPGNNGIKPAMKVAIQ